MRQLLHFEALYRLRGFASAARECDVTQSALSRSIQKLEEELGARLFDRTTHSVEPTDLGEGLIGRARDVVEAVRAFEEEADTQLAGARGHVRVGTGPYPAQPLLTNAIASLAERHPGIQVSVVAGTSKDLMAALLRRELECVVADTSKYEDSPAAEDLEVIELPTEALMVVMSADHPLASANEDLGAFARHAWAMPTPAPLGLRELPSPFEEAFAAGQFPFYRLETTAACLELARAGRALTIVPRSLAIDACRTGELIARAATHEMRTHDGIHLVRNRSRSPATRLLIDEIVTCAEQLA